MAKTLASDAYVIASTGIVVASTSIPLILSSTHNNKVLMMVNYWFDPQGWVRHDFYDLVCYFCSCSA